MIRLVINRHSHSSYKSLFKSQCTNYCRTPIQNSSIKSMSQWAFTKEECDEFLSLKPEVISDIKSIPPYNTLPHLTSFINSMLEYNLTGGTIATGLNTIYIYKMISKPQDRTPENMRLAILIGWCIRFYEAALMIVDDYIDNADTRYTIPTWHSLPNIGKNAAIHSMFVENCMLFLVKKYFSEHPKYKNIQGTFIDTLFCFNYGQMLDTMPFKEENLAQEFLDVIYFGKSEKTSFYMSYTLPMYLAGIDNPELFKQIKNILFKLGTWLQMQNDYLDAFDDPKNRPIGTDIKERKVTWLSTTAFHKCTPAQKELFRKNYGKQSDDSVNEIIKLYKELRLPELYEENERKLHNEILKGIEDVPKDVIPHEVFFRTLGNLKERLITF